MRFILAFTLSLFFVSGYSQLDITKMSNRNKTEKRKKTRSKNGQVDGEKYIHLDSKFPSRLGGVACFLGSDFLIGVRWNALYGFGQKMQHRVGLFSQTLFTTGHLTSNKPVEYESRDGFVYDTLQHKLIMIPFEIGYEYYIIPPYAHGFSLRIGIHGGFHSLIDDSDQVSHFGDVRFGYQASLTIGAEYRFGPRFGLFAELDGGYTTLSKKLKGMPYYQNFLTSFSFGICFDFGHISNRQM